MFISVDRYSGVESFNKNIDYLNLITEFSVGLLCIHSTILLGVFVYRFAVIAIFCYQYFVLKL